MLYATGVVQVNGAAVVRSTAVLNGDKIQTSKGAAGTLNLSGTSVLVHADSLVTFSGDSMRITAGAATIKTGQQMSASVGAWAVAPAQKTSRYNVTLAAKTVTFNALEGALTVKGFGRTFNVPAGTFLTLDSEPQGGAGGNTADMGRPRTGLIVGAALIALTGMIAGIGMSQDASPSVP